MLPKQLVILGGGASVRPYWDGEYKDKGLFTLLPKLFSCGLNYSYKFVESTVYSAVDEKFFNENYKEILNLPLYISKLHTTVFQPALGKCYFFPSSWHYDRECYGGIYTSTLAGLFALSLFIKIMDEGEIFLLGYDYGPTRDAEGKPLVDNFGRPFSHWYQGKVEHRGIGKINWYTSTHEDPKKKGERITNAQREFGVYASESKVKIYNVNPQSAIDTFEKISYEQFFTKIETTEHNQDEIRKELEMKCKGLVYMYEVLSKQGMKFDPKGTILPGGGPFNVK